jgi:hypothetical protein
VDEPQTAGINPNGGIAGRLLKFGIDHPVVNRLEAFCWRALERTEGAHDVSEALLFLAHAEDRERANSVARTIFRSPTAVLESCSIPGEMPPIRGRLAHDDA